MFRGGSMILGRIEHGELSLDTPIPSDWEGLLVRVEPCSPDQAMLDLAGPDLAQRLAALHAMGPMEFEPGERERIADELRALDQWSREQMLQISEQLP